MRGLKFALGVPAFAVTVAALVFYVWNLLIRREVVANATLAWFPTFAIAWFFIVSGASALLYRTGGPNR